MAGMGTVTPETSLSILNRKPPEEAREGRDVIATRKRGTGGGASAPLLSDGSGSGSGSGSGLVLAAPAVAGARVSSRPVRSTSGAWSLAERDLCPPPQPPLSPHAYLFIFSWYI